MKRKAGATSQVCILKKVVYDEIGINIEIEEGDGKPNDFIVKTSLDDIDKEKLLFALLNKYKLAGKSYLYINSQVVFTRNWDKYICEHYALFLDWSKFICEGTYRPINRLYCKWRDTSCTVTSEYPAASHLLIKFYTGVERPGGDVEGAPGMVVLRKGASYSSGYWDSEVPLIGAVIRSKIGLEDETYKYLIVWQ